MSVKSCPGGKERMSCNILVVDDEKELADVLELYLINDGYTVHKCYTGAEALDCIAHTDLDLALLDVMLPDADGFQLCKKIREKSYCPIIMLTARGSDGDKIMGLTIGADDYITKPFNPLEVVARVKTQLQASVCLKKRQWTRQQRIIHQKTILS